MFTYLITKILPLIFSPLGIVLILLIFYIFSKKAKFVYSAFLLLFIFSNGIVSGSLWRFLEYPWKRLDYNVVDTADGIVVLSGGGILPVGRSKVIEWTDPDRFFAGINLYKAEKATKLIFTGGASPLSLNRPPEGDLYLNEAISMGIPRKDIFTTYRVFNTLQEAKAIKKLLNKELNSSQRKIILVTSAFHMKRAKRVFEKEGMNVIPYPVDFKTTDKHSNALRNPLKWMPNATYLKKSSMAIREIIGRIIYGS